MVDLVLQAQLVAVVVSSAGNDLQTSVFGSWRMDLTDLASGHSSYPSDAAGIPDVSWYAASCVGRVADSLQSPAVQDAGPCVACEAGRYVTTEKHTAAVTVHWHMGSADQRSSETYWEQSAALAGILSLATLRKSVSSKSFHNTLRNTYLDHGTVPGASSCDCHFQEHAAV